MSMTSYEVTSTPIEGKWFEINPKAIDRTLFQNKREDNNQERTRLLILKAFTELKNNPQKYGEKFQTSMPKKVWSVMTAAELKEIASIFGDHNANWIEQAFEWAQRIYNGESWETVCNNNDTANWYRLVVWENGYARLVGGSNNVPINLPASYVFNYDYFSFSRVYNAVPLVVRYTR